MNHLFPKKGFRIKFTESYIPDFVRCIWILQNQLFQVKNTFYQLRTCRNIFIKINHKKFFAFPRPQTINIFACFELRYHLIYEYKDRYEAKKNSGVVGMRSGGTFSDNIADIQTIFFMIVWLFSSWESIWTKVISNHKLHLEDSML